MRPLLGGNKRILPMGNYRNVPPSDRRDFGERKAVMLLTFPTPGQTCIAHGRAGLRTPGSRAALVIRCSAPCLASRS